MNPTAETSDLLRVIQMVTEGWGTFFCIVAIIVIRQTRWEDKKKADRLLRFITADGLLLIMDILFAGFQGQPGILSLHIVGIAKLLVFVMGYLLIITGVAYFGELIESRVDVSVRNWRRIEYGISIIGLVMVLINILYPFLYRFDENNNYYRLPGNWLTGFTFFLGVLLVLALILNFFRIMTGLERLAVCSALILPMISIVLDMLYHEMSLAIISTCIAVILTFVSHMMDYTEMVANREREREKWIADENIRLLHNQIKPHFIYNAITGIYYGLDEDVPRSKKALKSLSGYLRGSLDVLDERECVEFSKELSTVQSYLDVEAFRFEDQIRFEADIEDRDFKIPAFSLQTLVENAVRHGIRENDPPEGTIRIRTKPVNGFHQIEIEDDGTGFDVDEAFEKEGVHIGLKNTKERLELMCAGTMEVESEVGTGTKIRIRIPVEQSILQQSPTSR